MQVQAVILKHKVDADVFFNWLDLEMQGYCPDGVVDKDPTLCLAIPGNTPIHDTILAERRELKFVFDGI